MSFIVRKPLKTFKMKKSLLEAFPQDKESKHNLSLKG